MSANPERAQVDAAPAPVKAEAGTSVERRELLRKFGVYAAVTAPAMTVLLALRLGGREGVAQQLPQRGEGAAAVLWGCGVAGHVQSLASFTGWQALAS